MGGFGWMDFKDIKMTITHETVVGHEMIQTHNENTKFKDTITIVIWAVPQIFHIYLLMALCWNVHKLFQEYKCQTLSTARIKRMNKQPSL